MSNWMVSHCDMQIRFFSLIHKWFFQPYVGRAFWLKFPSFLSHFVQPYFSWCVLFHVISFHFCHYFMKFHYVKSFMQIKDASRTTKTYFQGIKIKIFWNNKWKKQTHSFLIMYSSNQFWFKSSLMRRLRKLEINWK